jgi:uncharacterized delta-60 repeat protein
MRIFLSSLKIFSIAFILTFVSCKVKDFNYINVEKYARLNAAGILLGPEQLMLLVPSTSPNILTTPTIRVSGVLALDTVSLYRDNKCTIKVGEGVSLGTDIDIQVSGLVAGDNTLYAKLVSGEGKVSTCSIQGLNYNLVTDPSVTGTYFDWEVYSVLVQPDQKVLIGGGFDMTSTKMHKRLVNFNSDLTTINSNFNIGEGFSWDVNSIDEQPDGKLLVGGNFITYDNVTENRIIRLNSDGSKDGTFVTGTGFDGSVSQLKILPDGKILVVGIFTTYNGVASSGIVRLNSDGTRDATFTVGTGFTGGSPNRFVIQSDGKIVVAGGFTTYAGVGSSRIVRLNTNGTRDGTFSIGSGFNSSVIDLAQQSDGKLVIMGMFTTYKGLSQPGLVRLLSNGNLDSTLSVGTGLSSFFSGDVEIQSDGKIILTGAFTTYNGVTANRIVRINPDGSIDSTFNYGTGFDFDTYKSHVFPSGKILVSGYTNSYNETSIRKNIILNTNGSIDSASSLNNAFFGEIYDVKLLSNGTYLFAGNFSSVNAIRKVGLSRINHDGTLDTGFYHNAFFWGGNVFTLKIDENKKILVGGSFSSYAGYYGTFLGVPGYLGGITQKCLARLFSDGTLDTSFDASVGCSGGVPFSSVYSIVPLSDGKMFIGGDFTSFNSVTSNYFAKLNSDGTVDSSFNIGTGFNNEVNAIHVQSDGKILVGGRFTTYKGITHNRIVRLMPNGDVDTTFDVGIGFGSFINVITQDHNGKILVGGWLSTFNGQSRLGLVRLNTDGSEDTSMALGTGFDNDVTSIVVNDDNSIYVGGYFNDYNGTPVSGIVKLSATGSIDSAFNTGAGVEVGEGVTSLGVKANGSLVGGTTSDIYDNKSIGYYFDITPTGILNFPAN